MTLPIVLLPGMHGTTELMSELKLLLAEQHQVVAIDFPADQPLGYAELTEFVSRRLPAGPCVVLGESFSGPLAIGLAQHVRERIRGIVLASTFVRAPMPVAFARIVRLINHNWLPHWLIEGVLLGSYQAPHVSAVLRRLLAEMPASVFRKRALEALLIDKTADLAAIHCPVLCLVGSGDWLLGRRGLGQILAARPEARVVELAASHMLLATHPSQAGAAILSFCRSLESQHSR